jgi:hypothetical protein
MRKNINKIRYLSMAKVIYDNEDNYYGHCPFPEHENCYLNIYREHWFYCDKCKIKWYWGSNLFSSWKEENEDVWAKNRKKIKNYEEITVEKMGTVGRKGKWFGQNYRHYE